MTGLFLSVASALHAAKPPQMFGVNLSGGEGGSFYSADNTATWSDGQLKRNFPRGRFGWDYNYPNQAQFDYYRARGVTLVRLPIRWERIQHSLNATLDATEMGRLDAAITCARNAGMQVLLDLHNYNYYNIYTAGYWSNPSAKVNAQPNPVVTIAHFQNLWGQLANRYKDEPAIFGYDLMNEPKGKLSEWQPAAQGAITTIRTYDKKHWVIVEGVNWAGAQSWNSTNPDVNNSTLNVTDSAGKLIYSAHSYWDRSYQVGTNYKFDGVYATYVQEAGSPSMGVDCMKPFVDWIVAKGYNGLIGEYGVPWATDSASWSGALDTSLAYLKTNGLSGTYWAGGSWMSGYALGCAPSPLTAADRPQMTVMKKYGGVLFETEDVATVATSGDTISVIVDNAMNQGKGEQFLANAVGDYVTYTVPNVPAGTYNIILGVKKYSSRGKFQLAIADAGSTTWVNQGGEQDLYTGGTLFTTINLGSKSFATTGNKSFRFTVTGKHSSSSGYNLLFDYIQVQK